MRIGRSLTLVLALCAGPALARGEGSSRPAVRLSWVRSESALDCLSPVMLERELVERMGRDPFEGTPSQWIEGYVARGQGRLEVQLFERDEAGRTIGSRIFSEEAENCRSLDDAIELAIALIIDPNVRLAERAKLQAPASTVTPPLPKATRPSEPRPARRCIVAKPAPCVCAPRRAARQSCTCPSRDEPAQGNATKLRYADLSAGGLVMTGLFPVAAPGVELSATVGTRLGAVRLGMQLLPERRPNSEFGDYGYGATLFHLGACVPWTFSRLQWLNCLALGMGAIHVTVHRPLPLNPGDRLLGTGSLESGLSVQIAGPVRLDTRLFGIVPFGRADFHVLSQTGSRRIFLQSYIVPGAAIGISVRLL
jgi:hypothetical protein